MKLRMLAIGMILGAALTLTAGSAMSQNAGGGGCGGDGGKGSSGAGGTGGEGGAARIVEHGDDPIGHVPDPAQMQEMMKAWMDAMTPGEVHKLMAKGVGTWDTMTKIWMAGPDAPPTELAGTTEVKSVLGGRFLLQETHSQFPMPDATTGQMTNVPWDGMGLFGYDNYQKMHVGCWADTMGTQLLTMRGGVGHDGKTLTMYGEMDEPMLGVRGRLVKYVTSFVNDDHHVFSIYDLHAGDNYKVVEVVYTRKK